MDDSFTKARDCERGSYKITNIVLDLESIPAKAKDSDWWAVWVCMVDQGSSSDALLANLSRTVSQVQVDLEFSMEDDLRFFVKSSSNSGVVYLNGYEVKA